MAKGKNDPNATKKSSGKPNYRRSGKQTSDVKGSVQTGNKGSYHETGPIANIVTTSTSIAVRNIAGNRIPIPTTGIQNNAFTQLSGKFTVPGVFGIRYAPVFGIARGSQTDPVNLAARNLWVNLRSLYSNKIPYTAGAILMYSMALDGILTCINWIKRAYGIVFAFDARNRYVCDGLLWDMGLDPNDFRMNLPDVKTFVNKVCAQMTAFGVPSAFRFITDHMDATSHIYVDDMAVNAQYIIMSPDFVWHMDWANNKLYADYSIIGQPGAQNTWSTIVTNLTALIEDFVNNEDCYMIASDVARVFGDVSMVSPLNDDFMIGPEYDTNMLQIIHNMTWPLDLYNKQTAKPWEVTELQAPQNVGAITTTYSTGFEVVTTAAEIPSWVHAVSPGLFDFDGSEPSQDMLLLASNWKYAIAPISHATNSYKVRIETCGTLLPVSIDYLTMMDDVLNPNKRTYMTHPLKLGGDSNNNLELLDVNAVAQNTEAQFAIQTWNWHPMIPAGIFTRSASSNVVTVTYMPTGFIGQFDQYLTIDVEELKRIHEAIVLDRFDATGVGTLRMK